MTTMRLDSIETPGVDPLSEAWRVVRTASRWHAEGAEESARLNRALAVVEDALRSGSEAGQKPPAGNGG